MLVEIQNAVFRQGYKACSRCITHGKSASLETRQPSNTKLKHELHSAGIVGNGLFFMNIKQRVKQIVQNNSDHLGYTEESLRMLKSEEGQTNAIFACFGSAAQHCQHFEAALDEFLWVCSNMCKKPLSILDLDDVRAKPHKQTIGRLLAEIRKIVTIDDNTVEECMDSALTKRNFLIHHFFRQRNEKFLTENGRMEMLRELVAIESELKLATDLTNGMRVAVSTALGLSDEKEYMEASECDSASDTLFTMSISIPNSEKMK